MTIEEAHAGGIAEAHNAFEKLTGKQYMLHTARMFAWEKFLVRCKFTKHDIALVVKHLQGEVAAKRAFPPQLWFNNLIEDTDRFEEYLNDAKAKQRNAPMVWMDRDSMLHVMGGKADPARLEKMKDNVISMNERVRWHLNNMREAIKKGGL